MFAYDNRRAFLENESDFVMIGRAAIGNPLIFKEVRTYLEKGAEFQPSQKDRIESLNKFTSYYEKFEHLRSFSELRQQVMWFTKGLKGSRELRRNLLQTSSLDEINEILRKQVV